MLQSYKDEFVVEIQFPWFRRLLAGVNVLEDYDSNSINAQKFFYKRKYKLYPEVINGNNVNHARKWCKLCPEVYTWTCPGNSWLSGNQVGPETKK